MPNNNVQFISRKDFSSILCVARKLQVPIDKFANQSNTFYGWDKIDYYALNENELKQYYALLVIVAAEISDVVTATCE